MNRNLNYVLNAMSVLALCVACGSSGGDADTGPLRCDDTDCEARHRVCIAATDVSYATCGECVDGAYAFAGACHLQTTCKSDEYERVEPTPTSDRECAPYHEECAPGEFEDAAPTPTSNRSCAPCPDKHYCAGGSVEPESCRLTTTHGDPTLPCDRIADIGVGSEHACILTEYGKVLCWGDNDKGQRTPPTNVGEAVYLSVNNRQTCVVDVAGEGICWGEHGNYDNTEYKSKPSSLDPLIAIEAGPAHVCALTEYNKIVCWGWNANEEASPPTNPEFTRVLAGGYHSCGETIQGELLCWGRETAVGEVRRPPEDLGEFVDVTTDQHHICVVDSEGSVRCWGDDKSKDAMIVPDDLGLIQSVKAGSRHTCTLDQEGIVRCWGFMGQIGGLTEQELEDILRALPPSTKIAAGGAFACAVDETDAVRCWGKQSNMKVHNVPSELQP